MVVLDRRSWSSLMGYHVGTQPYMYTKSSEPTHTLVVPLYKEEVKIADVSIIRIDDKVSDVKVDFGLPMGEEDFEFEYIVTDMRALLLQLRNHDIMDSTDCVAKDFGNSVKQAVVGYVLILTILDELAMLFEESYATTQNEPGKSGYFAGVAHFGSSLFTAWEQEKDCVLRGYPHISRNYEYALSSIKLEAVNRSNAYGGLQAVALFNEPFDWSLDLDDYIALYSSED